MDVPKEIDDCIKQLIDHSLGLPTPEHTLESSFNTYQESQRQLHDPCREFYSRIREKDQVIERTREEASMNARALKRFVEENERLATQCENLLVKCEKWEKECLLYDRDWDALMEFINDVEERAREAETRVHELEEELKWISEELSVYKHDSEARVVDSASEESLFESVLDSLITEGVASAHAFLKANIRHRSCQKLLKMWNHLKPSTQKVLSLAAMVVALEIDKEDLRVNLQKAEVEVEVLFEENNILNEENRILLKQRHRQKCDSASGGELNSSASASIKSNKLDSTPMISSPTKQRIDFDNVDSPQSVF